MNAGNNVLMRKHSLLFGRNRRQKMSRKVGEQTQLCPCSVPAVVSTSRVKMQRTIEQRCTIVCVELVATETFHAICEAYKSETMSRTRVFEWHKEFNVLEKRGNAVAATIDSRFGTPDFF